MFQYSTASHPDPTRESNEFIKPLELIRNRMTALGKSVDRFYVKEDGANPKFYSDGSPLPGGLTWNATPEQVALAINEGRSVVFHDDHGYEDGSGWGSPGFGNDSISLLHNAASAVRRQRRLRQRRLPERSGELRRAHGGLQQTAARSA